MKTYSWVLTENRYKKGEHIQVSSKEIFLSPSECLKYHFSKYLFNYIIKYYSCSNKLMSFYIQRFCINKNNYFATDNFICANKFLIRKIESFRKKKRRIKYEKKPQYDIAGYRLANFSCDPCVVPDFPKNSIGVIYLNDRTRT